MGKRQRMVVKGGLVNIMDADIARKIKNGINKYRKGKIKLRFVHNGEAVSNARIDIKLVNHKFNFGANLFMLGEMENEKKNKDYEKFFSNIFNYATIPIFWDTLESKKNMPRFAEGSPRIYRRPPTDLCIRFCKEHEIKPKAHCLNFDAFVPDWIRGCSAEEHKKELDKRMRLLSEHYREDVFYWEVVNEMQLNNGKTSLYLENDVIEWSFATARKYFPKNRLMINENSRVVYPGFVGNRSAYYLLIEKLLKEKVPVDTIGFQAHYMFGDAFTKKFATPEFIYDFVEKYEEFGLPLEITEVTVPAIFNNDIDEDRQAELLKTLYSVWFSCKNMEGIVYWNLVDGYAYMADPGDMDAGENIFRGGLIDFNFRPKKAYTILENLIRKEWTTRIIANTDESGFAEGRAFYGKYHIGIKTKDICAEKDIYFERESKNPILVEV